MNPQPQARAVALFVTCIVDSLYPEIGRAAVRLLERHGVTVLFPVGQTCCGQPAFNSGHRNDARTIARHFLDVFHPLLDSGEVDAIVAPSGSCVAMVREYFPLLFADPAHRSDASRAERVSAVTFELSQYLVDVLGITGVDVTCRQRLTYHPCCHLLRELQVDRQPRQLLDALQGAQVVELTGATECCGFGGLFAVKNDGISSAMGRRKVANIVDAGADAVVVNDASCMTHLNGLLDRDGHRCRAVHIAQILAGTATLDSPVPR